MKGDSVKSTLWNNLFRVRFKRKNMRFGKYRALIMVSFTKNPIHTLVFHFRGPMWVHYAKTCPQPATKCELCSDSRRALTSSCVKSQWYRTTRLHNLVQNCRSFVLAGTRICPCVFFFLLELTRPSGQHPSVPTVSGVFCVNRKPSTLPTTVTRESEMWPVTPVRNHRWGYIRVSVYHS